MNITFHPECVVIAGTAGTELTDAAKKKSFELFRNGLRLVRIVTYDELFRKVEILLALFGHVVETAKVGDVQHRSAAAVQSRLKRPCASPERATRLTALMPHRFVQSPRQRLAEG